MSQPALWEAEKAPYVRPKMDEIERRPSNGLVAVSTFSGCGGSSLGLRMAGWSVPYAVEFVAPAAETYAANSSTAFVDRRDVREVSGEDVLRRLGAARGELDLFEGSPPCASFSAAGKGESGWGTVKKYSETEQRTDDLFWEWARLLDELQPRAFLAENVPGLARGRALDEYGRKIVAELSSIGYRVNVRTLNAAHFGTPQDRRRLIFLGIRRDLGTEIPEFPSPTTPEPFSLRDALDAVDRDVPADVEAASMERFAVGRTWKAIVEARAAGVEFEPSRIPCQRCGEPLWKHSGLVVSATTKAVSKAFCADGEPAAILKDYFSLVVPTLDRPSPTVTATAASVGAASVTHPTECRKFTPAELRSISGFPEDFVLTGSYAQRVERIGRAVPPPLYEAIGKTIANYLGGNE